MKSENDTRLALKAAYKRLRKDVSILGSFLEAIDHHELKGPGLLHIREKTADIVKWAGDVNGYWNVLNTGGTDHGD